MIQPDTIIRSKRKTLSVSIDYLGRVTVRAPLRCTKERIFSFLQEKESWILRKQAQMKSAKIKLPTDNLDGYTVYLLGKAYTLKLLSGREITFDEETAIVYLPEKNAEKRLIGWLKKNALQIFTKLVVRFAAIMGVEYKSVCISSARTRWGSCSFDNKLRFSYRLLYASQDVIEYVIVHELAHIRHKNHSQKFWGEVGKYIPDYKNKRKWLKLHGIFMQIF